MYGAVAYARWRVSNGFVSRLITAKNRVAPLKIEDIVRLELCGVLTGARLRKVITAEMKTTQFDRVIHIMDSEIVHAMVHNDSYGFNTYAGNRLGEIERISAAHEITPEYFWTPGRLNISDLVTRGCSPADMGEGSEWQGPRMLEQEEEFWEVKREVQTGVNIPERKKVVLAVQAVDNLATRICHHRFSKWSRLRNTTARILKLYERFKHDGVNDPQLHHTDLSKAETFWIKEAQKELSIDSKQLKKFRPRYNDVGLMIVGGRTERWMENTWNKQYFVLLPKNHNISLLIARYEHALGGHLGRDATVSKIRATYWILGVKSLVGKIIDNCTFCKEKLKKLQEQIMSSLPIERLKPSPPFTNTMVDYFGPFTISGEVQKRVRGKCYGVIFTCLSARAVHIDIAADYSTPGFMMVLRRFASIRGWPTKFFSDKGSQLVGASNELSTVIDNIAWNEIEDRSRTAGKGTEWNFSPADAPWYNGAVEALVKSTKRALNVSVGETVLRFSELQTSMYEAAQLVNQRPIGNHPSDPSDGVYLCPNDLLLGRATAEIPQGPFLDRCSQRFRFDFVQRVVDGFWKRWVREVFPNLVINPKWHTERRNLKNNDVVLLQDSNALRGTWKKALVVDATPSDDGKVRHVKVRYMSNEKLFSTVDRPVQRLILLVPADE